MPLSIFLLLGSFESLIYEEEMIFWSHVREIFLLRGTTVDGCALVSEIIICSHVCIVQQAS